ncbi:hypothetical protein HanPSC8_Chr04g0161021 [Helianthus annuus]|nr:hypothetical protein HanPSC8_Chr04g0161021 [Helianthus annuus]
MTIEIRFFLTIYFLMWIYLLLVKFYVILALFCIYHIVNPSCYNFSCHIFRTVVAQRVYLSIKQIKMINWDLHSIGRVFS